MARLLFFFSCLMFFFSSGGLRGQACGQLDIRHRSDIPSACSQMTLTMKMDRMGRPYLYVAGKEAGLKIYELPSPEAPRLLTTIPVAGLGGLQVMNLFQKDRFLFLALGNHFGTNRQAPGLAVIDVTDPGAAKVTDLWVYSVPQGGAGVVAAEGDYVYLGAMEHGLMIFKAGEDHKLEFLSRFVPDISYPDPKPDPAKYNARGMAVSGEKIYLCYDAGGVRVIDVSDRSHPRETGRYANPALNNLPRAYNNAVIDGSLLYVAVDYCGLEILNVADPRNIRLQGWWNPWNCQSHPLRWFSSPGHANELELDRECRLLFLSTGKSDLHVLDISRPEMPDSCGYYGGVENETGTWGLDAFHGKLFLSYICAAIPFSSAWTGVKVLTYNNRCATGGEEVRSSPLSFFPNPSSDHLNITWDQFPEKAGEIQVFNLLGQSFPLTDGRSAGRDLSIDVSGLPEGVFILRMKAGRQIRTGKFIVKR